MYKQSLLATLPLSAAVIIAAALFANAGDLYPDPGPIKPTMHDLEEIYSVVAAPQSCPPCTWDYQYLAVADGQTVIAVPGSGVLHGFWTKNLGDQSAVSGITVFSGDPNAGGITVGQFLNHHMGTPAVFSSKFFELDIAFENGLYLRGLFTSSNVTVLYRSPN